uniref:Uncharacterized protein n=1 Tax=Timema bartmani TaxID=61472 RepID=A0A7R9F6A5_9NEOP|nr:unnamed protein product [Timema bartmani]
MSDTSATVNGNCPANTHVSFRKAYDHDDLHEDPNFPLQVDTTLTPTGSYSKLTLTLLRAIARALTPGISSNELQRPNGLRGRPDGERLKYNTLVVMKGGQTGASERLSARA